MKTLVAALALLACACAVRLPQARECDPAGRGRPVCGLMNPEDVIPLPASHWVLASELRRPGEPRGSIVAFTLDGDGAATTLVGPSAPAEWLDDPFLAKNKEICPGPLPADGLEPHGMDLVVERTPPWMLLVVNHGTRESIEIYDVTPSKHDDVAPRLRWMGCIPLPDGYAANDVAAMDDGRLVASTTRIRFVDWVLAIFRMTMGSPLGDAMDWSFDQGWRHVDHTRVGLPNGVAVDATGRLFVADWAGSRLVRVDRATGRRDEIPLPHHPDNVSWAPDGRLVVAGQIGSVREAFGCVDGHVRNCGQPWSVLAVDPDTLAVAMLAQGDGRDFGAASSAAFAKHTLVVGTWAGDRALRLPVP